VKIGRGDWERLKKKKKKKKKKGNAWGDGCFWK
jgi:hypothetical protein